ncbi:MAG TPA: alkaline phosphatase D family protein [Geminicoccaceae bacterium]|nr:alkaline phosphatase D family protein [Geminicoccaceae bacterium]
MIWPVRQTIQLAAMVACTLAAPVRSDEGPPLTRIAFGSCVHQDRPQPIWDAILAWRPELFVFAGDNVYGDLAPGAASRLEDAYAKAAEIEGYRALRAQVPVLATWDDHDYGHNDAGGDFPYREEAKALFLDFWEIPADDPRRSREGIYHAQIFGPAGMRLQVILLDTRSFRSPLTPTDQHGAPGKERYVPDPDPAKTMLGAAQWAWLRAQLQEPAELRLIVSSVQVLAEGHGWERWGNLPRERERLLDLIAANGANGVIFLSGDRHVGGLYRRPGAPYALYEITSSGLNMFYAAAREAGPLRLGQVYGRENFGTIDIDWWAGEVMLSVRALNGEPVRRTVIALAALSTR